MVSLAKQLFLALHQRITAKIVIAILAGMAAVELVQRQLLDRAEESWLLADLRAQALAAAKAVHHAFTAGPRGELESTPTAVLDILRQAGDASRVAVMDSAGRVVFASGSEPGGTRLGMGPHDESRGRVGDSHRFVVPLHDATCLRSDPPELAALASLVVDQDDARRRAHLYGAHRALEYSLGLAMLVICGLVLLVVWVVVQRPLAQLMSAVRRIEQGDLEVHCQAPVADEFGRFAGGVNAMLASLRAKNRELRVLHETRLAQADRLATMGQLASGLAHEIKTPLHGINSALTVIRSRTTAETNAIIGEVQAQVMRVVRTVTEMLTYARPQAFRSELCDVRQVVSRALALLNADIQARGIRLLQEVAPDLPQTMVDQEKLQQVYVNLILNAMQAVGQGGLVRVSLSWDRHSNLLVSYVSDDGPGISPEAAKHVFEPFFTTKKGGHGLGLATSRVLVERNGGTLRLLTSTGKGACFEILLPVITATAPQSPAGMGAAETDEGLDAVLFGLACRCPAGAEEHCPIEAIRRTRLLDLTQRFEAVRRLDGPQKQRACWLHLQCRSGRQHPLVDPCPAAPEARDGGVPS